MAGERLNFGSESESAPEGRVVGVEEDVAIVFQDGLPGVALCCGEGWPRNGGVGAEWSVSDRLRFWGWERASQQRSGTPHL